MVQLAWQLGWLAWVAQLVGLDLANKAKRDAAKPAASCIQHPVTLNYTVFMLAKVSPPMLWPWRATHIAGPVTRLQAPCRHTGCCQLIMPTCRAIQTPHTGVRGCLDHVGAVGALSLQQSSMRTVNMLKHV
jgi:hypothetical protein